MDEQARSARGSLSRQPRCSRGCGCEEHLFFVCECGCLPHAPIGFPA